MQVPNKIEYTTANNDENLLKEIKSLDGFYFLPNLGNLGDILISCSEFQYFNLTKLKYDVIDIFNIKKQIKILT